MVQPNAKDVELMVEEKVEAILNAPHLFAVFSRPMRFVGVLVGRLIEVVEVVSEIVMQHPAIGSNARLKGQRQIVDAVEPRSAK